MSLFPEDNRPTPGRGIDTGQGPERYRGFTLIELLVVIAVAVIIATVAVPNFQAFAARNQVNAEVLRIRTALAMAKNTAVTRRKTITVCPSIDRTECLTDWSAPLMVVEGPMDKGVRKSDEPVLKVLEAGNASSVSFRNDYRYIRFPQTGWPRGYNGTFVVCSDGGAGAHVVLSNLGRVRNARMDC
ncbi:GspH/FimT family pseudopilin [Litchfieldella xinjiangensis]|uniref:GspH/FimT family pseudopilin n=1 Tax=Litchfieldella xinjiangensis TaxID=1166948 RepID=UPI0005B92531|nr:GspH/FimT family pseudopilin [Halomonas xinjiangensis]